jgi:class 3 adenylate cyclase
MPEINPRPSPEIEAIVTRIIRSMEAGDIPALRRMLTLGPEFRAIGTDPAEWWDHETFMPVFEAQTREMAGMSFAFDHLEAWEAGHAAWGAARLSGTLGDAEFDMRHTFVFVLDAGTWRMVQWHASDPVPNADTIGFDLTVTVSEILDALDVEQDLGGFADEGMLTLMFTDVENSTAHAREMGDRRYSELMAEHISLVGDLAERRGGQVIKSVGDGALLVFASARAGVGCAVEIQRATRAADAPYAVRIGVHAGDVIRTDTDVMGLAVNKAARVTSAAAGGQIVVSSVIRELVGADLSFRFGDSFLAELKGIDGIHELVQVDWRSALYAQD